MYRFDSKIGGYVGLRQQGKGALPVAVIRHVAAVIRFRDHFDAEKHRRN
jgi:hypothetical protein